MPESLEVSLDELSLAWRRLTFDRPDRCFVVHPYLLNWLGQDSSTWLNGIRQHLANGYEPKTCRVCFVPKGGSLLRPGAVLHPEDEVVYNLLVGRLMPKIHFALAEFQGNPDLGYQL